MSPVGGVIRLSIRPTIHSIAAAFLLLSVITAPDTGADDGEWGEWKFYKGKGWSNVSVFEEERGLVLVCITDTPPAYLLAYPNYLLRTSLFVRIYDKPAFHWAKEIEITTGMTIRNLAEVRIGKRDPQRVTATLVDEGSAKPFLLMASPHREDEEAIGVEGLELMAGIVGDALRREDKLSIQIGNAPTLTIPTEGAAAVMDELDAVCPMSEGAEVDTSAAVIEEAPPPQIIEAWSCFEQWGDRSTTLFALTRYKGRKGRVDVAGVSHEAVFSVAGLNRRWEWGELTADGSYRYAVVLEPNSRAAYTDFTFADEKGNAKPSRYYSCERSR